MGNLVAIDAGIACWDSKYTYGFWRPVTAIHQADAALNPATQPDPAWTPLLVTPNHPEYPAAHGCLTAAEAEMLKTFLGTARIEIDLDSAVTGTTRHYARVQDLTHEIVDARVWGGLHYRGSVEAGVAIGREVAHWTLHRYFRPVDDDNDTGGDHSTGH
jgi:hypothetical protein